MKSDLCGFPTRIKHRPRSVLYTYATGAHVHVETGRTIDAHPLDEYFAEVIRRFRWERLRSEQKKKELVGRTPEQRAAVERILTTAAAKLLGSSDSSSNAAAILGLSAAEAVSQGANAKARTAYKALALLVHPDKCLLPDAKRAFQTLTDAYKVRFNAATCLAFFFLFFPPFSVSQGCPLASQKLHFG